MSSPIHRRTLLAGIGALVASGAFTRSEAAAAAISEERWMFELCKALRLLAPGEDKLAAAEMAKRLARPGRVDLGIDALVARSATVSARSQMGGATGGANTAEWLSPSSGSGTVVLRTLVRRPGRQMATFKIRGGPNVVSFGAQGSRAIDVPTGDEKRSLQGLYLRSGWLDLSVSLAPGGALQSVALFPEAASPIEPIDGWKPDRPLTYGAKAATIVRLGGWEDELPPKDPEPKRIDAIGGWDQPGMSVKRIRIDATGVYTCAARISGAVPGVIQIGQALAFPRVGVTGLPNATAGGLLTVSLATLALDAGDYDITFSTSKTSALHELLLVRRDATDTQYLAIARAHGFELGPAAGANVTTEVDATGLISNVAAVRNWLAGPATPAAKAATRSYPIPKAPQAPLPISPVWPTDS